MVGARRSLGRRRGRKRKRGKHFSMSPSRGSGGETCKGWKIPAVARRWGRAPQCSDEKGSLNGRRGGRKELSSPPPPPFFHMGANLCGAFLKSSWEAAEGEGEGLAQKKRRERLGSSFLLSSSSSSVPEAATFLSLLLLPPSYTPLSAPTLFLPKKKRDGGKNSFPLPLRINLFSLTAKASQPEKAV